MEKENNVRSNKKFKFQVNKSGKKMPHLKQ